MPILWSESNKEIQRFLKPDLGLRGWDDLSKNDKEKIWHYLELYFFNAEIKEQCSPYGLVKRYYEFYGNDREQNIKREIIEASILDLNEKYKAKSFAENYLKYPDLNTACYDFYNIFMNQTEAVVMELLSIYVKLLYEFTKKEFDFKLENESEEDYLQRKKEYYYVDKFAERLNDIFLQFGIKYCLTRDGFIPRQEEKIIKEIYEPVLSYLSHPKWKEVSKILSDAFDEYRKNTSQGYSNCVTNTVSAIEAFLQILVNGKTRKGEISKLIPEAQKKGLIPNDFFTKKIFDNIEAVIARQRSEMGTAHPNKEYADEKNARTLLNLAMIFIQHCIQI